MKRKPAFMAMLLASSAISGSGLSADPIMDASRQAASYIAAKRQYAGVLAKTIGIPESNGYRLVAVAGPEWQVGDMIAVNNPANILSYKCRFKKSQLPPATAWTDLPDITETSPIDFSLGLPAGVLKFLGKWGASAHLDFTHNATGRYSLSDLSGPIVAEHDFEAAMVEKTCFQERKGPSLIVRGVISGTESFSSGKALGAGAGVKILNSDLFTLKYDNNHAYEVSDKTPAPKFYVLVLDLPGNRGSSTSEFVVPPPEVIATLESLNIAIPKK
jgi:hypothetical protein